MSKRPIEPGNEADLRSRAHSRLTGRSADDGGRESAWASLRVLYELASSPSTASDALALLHELQVHQVELEMQGEELRNAIAELEAALRRQIQLYDHCPVGCFTVDRSTAVHELNRTGADLLGGEPDALVGQTLDSFLAPDSSRALHAMLTRVGGGNRGEACELQLMAGEGANRLVQASINADPAGQRFLVALVKIGDHKTA